MVGESHACVLCMRSQIMFAWYVPASKLEAEAVSQAGSQPVMPPWPKNEGVKVKSQPLTPR